MPEALYRTNQVAGILNVTDATIRKWIKTGKLKGIKLPDGSHRIPQAEIDRITQIEEV